MFQRIISSNSSSVMTGMPSVRALSSLLPAASPARTYDVFFETEDDALPPKDSTMALASSRVYFVSVPVRTNVLPRKRLSRRYSRLSMLTPASRSMRI